MKPQHKLTACLKPTHMPISYRHSCDILKNYINFVYLNLTPMLYSMTGFGKAVVDTADKKITVEIKSLNSKQMDLTVRLPQSYRDKEADIRSNVAHHLQRGKTDLIITSESVGGDASVSLNLQAIAAYRRQIQEASVALGIPEPADWYSVLMRFPDTLSSKVAPEASAEEMEALDFAVESAIASLMAHRRAEGLKLEEFFTERIRKISALLAQVPQYEKERLVRIRARIEDSLSKITVADYDKGRLEQEMIFYIEKLDITEEKQRLAQHLDYFMQTLGSDEVGQGKKLGFIAQEMGREINTLGSKSNQAEMQILVVKMKDELEQIKEQVLNVM